jgi:Uma2 family endonuclease
MAAPATSPRASRSPPQLQNGDKLSRDEFERRYAAMPPGTGAELIEGEVHLMPSPTRWDEHGSPQLDVATWIGTYRARTTGTSGADNATVRLDLDNEPQPDIALIIEPSRGGQATFSDDGYLVGAPEFVAEISASTVSIDLHKKLQVYRRNAVREYLVWRVIDGEIDWFILKGDTYERLEISQDGIYRSPTFPGLWLDAAALLHRDMGRVLDVVQEGLGSAEHGAFVAQLGQTRRA